MGSLKGKTQIKEFYYNLFFLFCFFYSLHSFIFFLLCLIVWHCLIILKYRRIQEKFFQKLEINNLFFHYDIVRFIP